MTNRIVCCLALSLLMGILYGRYESLWFAGGLLFLLIYTGIVMIGHGRERAWLAVLFRSVVCLSLFCAGAGHFRAEQAVRDRLEATLAEGDRITVQGQVCKKEEKAEQWIYYLTDTQVLAGGAVYPSHGILIYSSNVHIQPGNILKVTGTYAPFQISRNEGNFNEKQYYQSKKIEFRVYAEQEMLISRKENRYAVFLGRVRRNLRSVFEQCMSQENAGVMANMTLGDKTLLDTDIKSLYQRAGISHILAISGLHVSMFGMGAFRLLQKSGCPRKLGALLSIGSVYSFGLLSGMEISTVRAVCMFVLLMTAQMTGCSYDSLTALGISAVIQFWENPFVLDYAGFLFSYGAVLGVTVIAKVLKGTTGSREQKTIEQKRQRNRKQERRQEQEKRNSRWIGRISQGKKMKNALQGILSGLLGRMAGTIWDTVFISFCIQLATLPLSLYFYYEISCYSVFVNGCILPFMGALLFLGILGAAAGSMFSVLGSVLLLPAGWMLSANKWICQMFLNLPGAVRITGKPSLEIILVYYCMLCLGLYLFWNRRKKSSALGIMAALMILLFVRKEKQFEVNVLDVGQGDGIFIQTEEGAHFFVDGGSSDVKQVGKYRILPFLKSRGISSVKGWIVSHADNDHISGLKELLEMGYPIEYLIVAEGMVRDEAAAELLSLAEQSGCEIVYMAPGMKFGTQEVIFHVLYPESSRQEQDEAKEKNALHKETYSNGQTQNTVQTADRNSASLVVSLEYGAFTGIFTGDIGTDQEQEIVEKLNISKQVDFYKAAHHGSDGSNSQPFLEALSPKLTVISCGKGNPYGHPGKDALKRINQTGSQVCCTMDEGQITICPEGGDIRVITYLSGKK